MKRFAASFLSAIFFSSMAYALPAQEPPAVSQNPIIEVPIQGTPAASQDAIIDVPIQETPPAPPVPPARRNPPPSEEPIEVPVKQKISSTEPYIGVEKIGFGHALQGNKLLGESDEFVEGTTVYCWTKIVTLIAPTTVTQVWFRDGDMVWSHSLEIDRNFARTWTHRPVSAGHWTVKVLNEDGDVIKSANFTVYPKTEAAPQ